MGQTENNYIDKLKNTLTLSKGYITNGNFG